MIQEQITALDRRPVHKHQAMHSLQGIREWLPLAFFADYLSVAIGPATIYCEYTRHLKRASTTQSKSKSPEFVLWDELGTIGLTAPSPHEFIEWCPP